jgi:hypothetical protein
MDGTTAHHPVAGSGSEAGPADGAYDENDAYNENDQYDQYGRHSRAEYDGEDDDQYDNQARADLAGPVTDVDVAGGAGWAPAAEDLVPPPSVLDDFIPDDPDDVREARLTRLLTASGVLVGAAAIVALAFAVVSYMSGGPQPSAPTAGGAPSHAAAQRADRAERPDAAAGQKLTDNSWVLESTQFAADPLGQYGGTFQVTNAANSMRTGVFTITELANGQPVAHLKGVAKDVAPGQTATVTVISSDKWVNGSTTMQFENSLR